MGGGASNFAPSIEQLLVTTMMIGRAIAAISSPGMFTIYDFHSPKAPPLKLDRQLQSNPFYVLRENYEDEDLDEVTRDPTEYEHLFFVEVGEDKIYIEDILQSNSCGWTALHACCMSFVTVNAGLAIIDEMIRRGGLEKDNNGNTVFDMKTSSGPGAFNSGWTPLHMACAYGVDPLVEKLIDIGCDVNTQNSYGFTPLLEACKRGYIQVVTFLLATTKSNPEYPKRRKVDPNVYPDSTIYVASPFAAAAPQRPLGEAVRAGFLSVVDILLQCEDVDINATNSLGWTALHEACFYNREEIVKRLLQAKCSTTIRTKDANALPYHLTNSQNVKNILKELGGPSAVPADHDLIDMLDILEEMASYQNNMNNNAYTTTKIEILDPNNFASSSNSSSNHDEYDRYYITNSSKYRDGNTGSSNYDEGDDDDEEDERYRYEREKYIDKLSTGLSINRHQVYNKSYTTTSTSTNTNDVNEDRYMNDDYSPRPYNIPHQTKTSPNKVSKNVTNQKSPSSHNTSGNLLGDLPSLQKSSLDGQYDDNTRTKKKSGNKLKVDTSNTKDIPKQFICELSHKMMTDPVKSIYGQVYEQNIIQHWLQTHGKICPITGAPLTEIDLKPLPQLREAIQQYIIEKASLKDTSVSSPANNIVTSSTTTATSNVSASGSNSTTKNDNVNKGSTTISSPVTHPVSARSPLGQKTSSVNETKTESKNDDIYDF